MTVGTNAVAQLNAAFATVADAHALPDAVRRSMAIALDELLTNSLSYGLPREGGEVTLEVELRPDRLIVTVSDNGEPFDPLGRPAPDTTSPLTDRPVGGLGIHLVRQLVDDVSYQRRADRNEVTLTKHLTAGSATHT
ncbi:MAG TPA: ATP-binding protein [Gemmatimonadaceae bacterium]|nr:ATP-binding protein [Gemmatimonadaceae bacterium]